GFTGFRGGGVSGADIAGVTGMGFGAASAPSVVRGAGGVTGSGVGSGTGTTATSARSSGCGRTVGTRHACQPSDAAVSPTTCNIRAASKAEENGVRITMLTTFPP